jgi:hypothetical protein
MPDYRKEDALSDDQLANLWFGWFAKDLIDLGERAYVILPDLSTKNQFGPCFWASRDDTTLPNRGDRCCVMFDNRGQVWILAWWPFST